MALKQEILLWCAQKYDDDDGDEDLRRIVDDGSNRLSRGMKGNPDNSPTTDPLRLWQLVKKRSKHPALSTLQSSEKVTSVVLGGETSQFDLLRSMHRTMTPVWQKHMRSSKEKKLELSTTIKISIFSLTNGASRSHAK